MSFLKGLKDEDRRAQADVSDLAERLARVGGKRGEYAVEPWVMQRELNRLLPSVPAGGFQFALDGARCTLADVHGYLVKAAGMLELVDPGFAADLRLAALRAEATATPDVMNRYTSSAQTTAEQRLYDEKAAAILAARIRHGRPL